MCSLRIWNHTLPQDRGLSKTKAQVEDIWDHLTEMVSTAPEQSGADAVCSCSFPFLQPPEFSPHLILGREFRERGSGGQKWCEDGGVWEGENGEDGGGLVAVSAGLEMCERGMVAKGAGLESICLPTTGLHQLSLWLHSIQAQKWSSGPIHTSCALFCSNCSSSFFLLLSLAHLILYLSSY